MRKKINSLLIIFLCILMTNVIAVSNIAGNSTGNVINDAQNQEGKINKNITSETYIVSKENLIISRILPVTTIKEFKSKFNLKQESIHVFDNEGKEEKKDGYIGTGMQIKFDDNKDTYIASVIGDITGNGNIEQIEVSKAIKHVIGLEKHQITGVYAVSTDVSGDGIIDQKDVSILIKYVVTGRLDIGELLRPASPIINVTSGVEGKNDWYTSSVTLEIKKPTESAIPITNMLVEITGSFNQETTSIPEGTTINIEEEGIYEIKSYTVSAVGVKSLESIKTIKIDKTAPTSAELIGKFNNEDGKAYEFNTTSFQNIYLETTKGIDEVSDVEEVTIEATGDNIIPAGTKAPVILQNDGTTEVKVTTVNKAGLRTEKTYIVIIDKIIRNPGGVITKLNDADGEDYVRDTWTNQNVYVEVEAGAEGITTTYQVEGANTVSKTKEPTTLTKEGISNITVINEDAYGNVSKKTITVKIDRQAPEKPTITVTGTKQVESSDWYIYDPSAVFTVEEEKTGSKIDHIEYELKDIVNNTVQRGKINNGGNIVVIKEGRYELKATSVDIAGNKSEGTIVTINVDKTDPIAGTMNLRKNNQGGENYADNTWTNQEVYLSVGNGSDDLSGHNTTVYQVEGPIRTEKITESTTLNEDGIYTITVTTTDVSGRSATREYTIKIDTQAPEKPTYEVVSGTKSNEENEWYNSNVTLKVVQGEVDLGNSGISRTTYQISGRKTIPETTIANEGTIDLEEEGIYNITLYNYDVAGNKSEANTFTIKIDKTDPIAGTMILRENNQNGQNYTNNTWTNQDIYIELQNGTDTLADGLSSVYRVSGAVNTEELTEPAKLTKEGIYTVTVITTDASGRVATREYTVKIDKHAPEMPSYEVMQGAKAEERNEWYNGNVTLKVLQGTTDLGGSGIARTTYKIEGQITTEEVNIADQGTINITEDGIYNITAYNYDIAGNKSEGNTITIKLDKTAPQNLEVNTDNKTGTDINTVISATENASGIVLYQVYVDGELYREIQTGEGQVNCNITGRSSGRHTILVKVKDLAGNENHVSKEVNMGRLVASDIECIEFMINDFAKTKNGANVTSGSEYIVSDTSVSETAKYIQVSTTDNQTIGELTGSIRVIRKDGTIVDAFEYYPQELAIAIAQYSDGSGSTWSHEANINMANTELNNTGKVEGTTTNGSIAIKDKQNSDNRFFVKDKKISGTKTYTRLIIKEITSNGVKIPFKITSNII